MALVSAPRTMTDRFPFTVSSESVASKIKASLGQRVALHSDNTSSSGDSASETASIW